MSIHVVKAVRLIALPPGEKSVLVAYAEHAHHDGTNARPSIKRICQETGYSESQARRHITALRERALLIPEGRTNGGRGKTTSYRVCPENGEGIYAENPVKMTPFEDAKGCHPEELKGVILHDKGCHFDNEKGVISDPFPSPRAYRTVQGIVSESSAAANARDPDASRETAAAAAGQETDDSAFLDAIARHGEGIRQAEGRAGVGFHAGHTPPMKAAAEALLTWYLAAFPERVSDLTAKLRAASSPVPVANQARYLRPYLLDCLAGAVPPVLDVSGPSVSPPPRVSTPPPDNSRIDRRARLKARLDPMFAQGGMR